MEENKILEGFTPADNHVLVVAEGNKYKSPNGVVSSLVKGGSLLSGKVVRIGKGVEKEKMGMEVLFLKYEVLELEQDIYLLEESENRQQIRMYKQNG